MNERDTQLHTNVLCIDCKKETTHAGAYYCQDCRIKRTLHEEHRRFKKLSQEKQVDILSNLAEKLERLRSYYIHGVNLK